MQAKFLHEMSRGRAGATIVLFPPAGRGATGYLGRVRNAHKVATVVLPGRERRLDEKPATDIAQVVGPLCDEIEAFVEADPVILQGHSLGAYVGHAAAVELQDRGVELAVLGVAGAEAPIRSPQVRRHELDDDAFVKAIATLGGTPPEIFAEESLRALFLPLLRADFALAETYAPDERRLRCPISASFGRSDADVDPAGVREWAKMTTADCAVEEFEGDHFYPDDNLDCLLRMSVALAASRHLTPETER